ncbi:MAG: hypothetical protein ACRC33_20430 [Gemmataceae bacterium]
MAEHSFDFDDYHRTIIGFHGTTATAADRLVAGEPFADSDNDNEWFGRGVYFWEYAPKQAWAWATQRHEDPAVIGAVIRLGNCFDLLDPENVQILKQAKDGFERRATESGRPIPVNRNADKRLDCAVFNYFYETAQARGKAVDSARAVYVPTASAERVWPRS